MSIRKKQAEAIIGALMTDLAAAGEFDALARVKQASSDAMGLFKKADPRPDLRKKAWTFESAATNLRDAFDDLKSAEEKIKLIATWIPELGAEGYLKDANTVAAGVREITTVVSGISSEFEAKIKQVEAKGFFEAMTPAFLRLKRKQVLKLVEDLKKNPSLVSIYDVRKTYNNFLIDMFISNLQAAADEMENSLDASKEEYEAEGEGPTDAASPATAEMTPDEDFEKYIAGGKKELDAFFAKYNIEDNPKAEFFNKARYDIAMAEIISNKDVKSLMSHFKRDSEAKKRLLAHPGFSDAAQRLHEKVTAQIEKASGLLDSLPALEL